MSAAAAPAPASRGLTCTQTFERHGIEVTDATTIDDVRRLFADKCSYGLQAIHYRLCVRPGAVQEGFLEKSRISHDMTDLSKLPGATKIVDAIKGEYLAEWGTAMALLNSDGSKALQEKHGGLPIPATDMRNGTQVTIVLKTESDSTPTAPAAAPQPGPSAPPSGAVPKS